MDWGDLEVFLAAVRAGTYTAAGRDLAMNRTTIGRRVDALERSLGVALFESSPLGFAPTPEGARVLAAAQGVEREVNAMVAEIGGAGRPSAPVRLAVSGGLGGEFLGELAQFAHGPGQMPVQLLAELDPLDAVSQRRADLGLALVRALPVRLTGVQVGTLSQATYRRRARGTGYGSVVVLRGRPGPAAGADRFAQSATRQSAVAGSSQQGPAEPGAGSADGIPG